VEIHIATELGAAFVASESQPGVYYRVFGSQCTCPARVTCKHQRQVEKILRARLEAEARAAVPADPFEGLVDEAPFASLFGAKVSGSAPRDLSVDGPEAQGGGVAVLAPSPCLLHNAYTRQNPTGACSKCGKPASEAQRLRWEARQALSANQSAVTQNPRP
jgi:hypothetical protein